MLRFIILGRHVICEGTINTFVSIEINEYRKNIYLKVYKYSFILIHQTDSIVKQSVLRSDSTCSNKSVILKSHYLR